jgi:hypothetical protein
LSQRRYAALEALRLADSGQLAQNPTQIMCGRRDQVALGHWLFTGQSGIWLANQPPCINSAPSTSMNFNMPSPLRDSEMH